MVLKKNMYAKVIFNYCHLINEKVVRSDFMDTSLIEGPIQIGYIVSLRKRVF